MGGKMKLFSVFKIGAFIGACLITQPAAAQICPFQATDTALWDQARDSLAPARWVQFFVTAQCPDNKTAAKNLFTPFFGSDASANNSAYSRIAITGRYTGDQTNTTTRATNGKTMVAFGQGGDLMDFQMTSIVVVAGIPAKLFSSKPKPGQENVALWVSYR